MWVVLDLEVGNSLGRIRKVERNGQVCRVFLFQAGSVRVEALNRKFCYKVNESFGLRER